MNEPIIRVVKWASVVLVAGFIGYFGRYLAMMIIKRMRKEPPEMNSVIKSESDKTTKNTYKLEKKRLKLEKKKSKKE
jgi:hypothetical protein